MLWQCVLYGYTYSLAGNAADEAARAATAAYAVSGDAAARARRRASRHLPGAWQGAGHRLRPRRAR